MADSADRAPDLKLSVVVLAPRGRDGDVARTLLVNQGIEAATVRTMEALIAAIGGNPGAILITEEALGSDRHHDLICVLDDQAPWSDLPFIVLTNGSRRTRSPEETDRINALNNAVLLPRPLHGDDLIRAVQSALKARRRQFDARDRLDELQNQSSKLRDSQARLHAMVNSINQMVWSTLPDGFHDYYNARWYEYTGMPVGSTDGDAWNGMFHPEDQERAFDRWSHSLETGEPYEIEYRLRHRSGEYRWVLGKAQPVRDDEGKIVRWYGTCTDIDDQVRARETMERSQHKLEQAVKKKTAELGEARKERERVWDTSVDLLTIVKPDATIQDANPAWQLLLGYERDATVGLDFLSITHPDDIEETKRVFGTVFERPLTKPYTFRLRHKDGSYRRFAWTASAHDGLAYPAGRDVTDQFVQAEALEKTEIALRQSQKLETIGQLTGGVAHDFNNLLMAIRSSLELLDRRLPADNKRMSGLVQNALKATDRGAGLTQRMLAFARKQELDPKPVDVSSSLNEMRDLIERSIGPQVAVTFDIDTNVPDALVDANQMEMAVLNLAVNARDAMDGVGTLSIKLDSLAVEQHLELKDGHYVRIRIRDNGKGMDGTTLAQAMEPFFTTKGVGKGTGLGLSMVHGLANQSGGTFRLHSEVGVGTSASIFLPVADATNANEVFETVQVEQARNDRILRILVVDDDFLVLFGTVALLEDLEHDVVQAGSAGEALNLYQATPNFDLVITDQAMPNMTGVELARELHKISPRLPVILASGYAEMPEGAGGHIAYRLEKPFTDILLQEAIRSVSEVTGA